MKAPEPPRKSQSPARATPTPQPRPPSPGRPTLEELQKRRRQAIEEGRKKLAVVHATLERDEGPTTVSVVLQSSEHFDGSTSISSNSASAGTSPTVSSYYENFGLTRTAAISKRQQIMAAGDQLSSASRQRRLALISQRERHAARVSMSAEDKTQALQSERDACRTALKWDHMQS